MTYYNYLGQAMPETAPEDNGKNNILGTSAGGETLQAPEHNSSVAGAGGGDKLIGASGDTTFWITDAHDIVVEQPGGGIDTENGWMPLRLQPNVENLVVQGTYNYGIGNALDNLIVVQYGQGNWLYGAAGNDVLVGDASPNTFLVRAGEGNDVIYNWDSGDQLQLQNYGFTTAAQIKSAMHQVGADTVIQLNASETLTIRDTTPADFADKQFLLPLDHSKLGALTFDDEFNALQLYNPSTGSGAWRTDFGGNLKSAGSYTLTQNGEMQVYTHPGFQGTGDHDLGLNPFSVQNGVLTITAQPIAQGDTSAAFGAGYSSGMLNTFGSFAQQYGYFEMRAEVPQVSGTWPAFWMMHWPFNGQGEADIMESLGATPQVDYRRAYGTDENVFDNGIKVDPTGYHTYGLLWTPQTVTFYFDDQAVLQAPTPASWTGPMSLIVNMAVGGFGGTPDANGFPAGMNVDYIRAYGLADGSSQVTHGSFEEPLATLHAGAVTSGQAATPAVFQDSGQPVTSAQILTFAAKPDASQLPAGKAFVIWQDSGALFGAVSNGKALDAPTPLMAGDLAQVTGTGTFLTDEKVVIGYWSPSSSAGASGKEAWALVFDPATHSISRNQLGAATGDVRFVANANGDYAASWTDPTGHVMGRDYDSFAYDGKGWYGQVIPLSGGLTGATADNGFIAANGSGQQLYTAFNSYMNVVGQVGFSAPTLTQAEGSSGVSDMTFTVGRTGDLWQKATVAWKVTGAGGHPVDASDFPGGVLPSGVVTFDINATSETIRVPVMGDTSIESDEQFTISLYNPIGTTLGAQVSATGTITNDDDGTSPPPPPPTSPPPVSPPPVSPPPVSPPPSNGQTITATTTPATLNGGAGNDTLVASQGADQLTGGGGADVFKWGSEPWAPAHVTDFTVGTDRLDLTGMLQAAGYAGSDPVADHYILLQSDGAGGTQVLFDPDGTGTTHPWPDYVIDLEHAQVSTWAQLSGGAASPPPPTSPPPVSPPPVSPPPVSPPPVSPPPSSGQTITASTTPATLNGGAGDDTLVASQGADQLTGGGGADVFRWGNEPWAPAHVTDFTVGTDRIDISDLLQASGYAGSDPVADHYVILQADGAGGTQVLFDPDGTAAGHPWPDYIIDLEHAQVTTWAQLAGSGGTSPPPPPTSPPPPPSTGGQTLTGSGNGSNLVGGAGDDTLIAGHGADIMTGAGGADHFAFNDVPWTAGHITDFTHGVDRIDVSGLLAKAGYSGSDPVADGYIKLIDDGQGNSWLYFDSDGRGTADPWGTLVTTIDHVSPAGIGPGDWIIG